MRWMERQIARPPATGWRRIRIDLTAMLVYVSVVYVGCLTIHPLGRDYLLLEQPGGVLRWETAIFGASPVGYHVVNLVLLYACMLCIYRLVHLTVRGPMWLGTLAATLFMANPVHSEAVLNVAGAVDLIPCLCALVALLLYAEQGICARWWNAILAPAVFAIATLPYRENFFLCLVIVLYEVLLADRTGRLRRFLPVAVVAGYAGYVHAEIFAFENLSIAGTFAPLYFIFYPIGFLPATARTFAERPWLGWVAGAVVLAVLVLIYRKAGRCVILFGLLSMAAFRLCQGGLPVDPVHLVGGGQLLLPAALFNVALVGLFYRMMDHPKWKRPIILLTTLLCVLFFSMQVRSVLVWRYAGAFVRAFQQEAAGRERIALLPDYQYYEGAPMCLSEAVSHDTPFSTRIPEVISLLPLHYGRPPAFEIAMPHLSPMDALLVVHGKQPLDLLCYPYDLARPGEATTPYAKVVATILPDTLNLALTFKEPTDPGQAVFPKVVGK